MPEEYFYDGGNGGSVSWRGGIARYRPDSSVPNEGSFVNESWQDGISRRIHQGCNEEELAEARYHDRMREQAWQSQQRHASYHSTPTPSSRPSPPKPQGPTQEEKNESFARDAFRRAAQNLRASSADEERLADEFNQRMEEQMNLKLKCASDAIIGGYSDADGSKVDFIDIPAYQKCMSSDGMPMVRLNVPPGQSLGSDDKSTNGSRNSAACFAERIIEGVSYAVPAGAGAYEYAKTKCPKNKYYPLCVGGSTIGAGVANGYRGWRDAADKEACQPRGTDDEGTSR